METAAEQTDRPTLMQLADPLLKVFGLAGAIIYGILFIAYQRYYAVVGIRPEDVGISSGFILVRSLGFIGLSIAVGSIVFALWWVLLGFRPGPTTFGDLVRYACCGILGILLSGYVSLAFDDISFPGFFIVGVAIFLTVATSAILHHSSRHTLSLAIIIALGAVAIIVIPALATMIRAGHMGESMAAGKQIRPYSILTVPVLDVSADQVSVVWSGPPLQKPALFGAAQSVDGILLGETSDAILVRASLDAKLVTIRLPSNSVTLIAR